MIVLNRECKGLVWHGNRSTLDVARLGFEIRGSFCGNNDQTGSALSRNPLMMLINRFSGVSFRQ